MFESFLSLFPPDNINTLNETNQISIVSSALPTNWLTGLIPAYDAFIDQGGGKSYGSGILQFLSALTTPSLEYWNSKEGWTGDWSTWFPRLYIFAYDWAGRQLAFDMSRRDKSSNEPLMALLEPGTGQVLEIPGRFVDLMEIYLVQYHDASIASSFYGAWRQNGGAQPGFSECVGYRIPLFLGGSDDVSNLSLIDVDVYVSLMGQLLQSATTR